MNSGKGQHGFTYLAVIFLVAAMGGGLAATAEVWSHSRQREKEAELLWVGNQFREAIGLYYQRTPGAARRYPDRLEELLEDRRFVNVQRYLRRIYADPMTGLPEWGLIPAPGGGIQGVHSLSDKPAIRRFAAADGPLVNAATVRDWRFVYLPPATSASRIPG
jgi:type II secretory pathway pseudopilin PulG